MAVWARARVWGFNLAAERSRRFAWISENHGLLCSVLSVGNSTHLQLSFLLKLEPMNKNQGEVDFHLVHGSIL